MVNAVSLFSGCGGCSLGLKQAGFSVKLAVDTDRHARSRNLSLINKARTVGSTGLSVFLEDSELIRLCAIAAIDLKC